LASIRMPTASSLVRFSSSFFEDCLAEYEYLVGHQEEHPAYKKIQ